MPALLFLCMAAFLAGFIDAIAGGGGLIQLPALFIFLPNQAIPALFGSNKLASIAGTGAAVAQYTRRVRVDWGLVLPMAVIAFATSLLGAAVVSQLRADVLRPLILMLLVVVAAYTFIRKDFGSLHAPRLDSRRRRWFGFALGAVLGFYDGFFGPGMGSFLVFTFIGLFGFGFLSATTAAKVVNFSTNLAAVLYFGLSGNILYAIALPMAACNVLGSLLGARLAILRGSAFVRVLFLIVLSAVIIKFTLDTFKPG